MSLWSLLAAFAAGALGSGHCVLMCGGVATAIGAARRGGDGAGAAAGGPGTMLLVHAGRLGGYAAFGALAGLLGLAPTLLAGPRSAPFVHAVAGMRLAAALLVVGIGARLVAARSGGPRWLRAPERWGAALWRRLAPRAGAWVPASPIARTLCLGALWACMPCGLVYTVYLAAAVSGGPAAGAALAASFGMGTLPALLGLGWFGRRAGTPGPAAARAVGAILIAGGAWTAVAPLAVLAGGAPFSAGVAAYCRAVF